MKSSIFTAYGVIRSISVFSRITSASDLQNCKHLRTDEQHSYVDSKLNINEIPGLFCKDGIIQYSDCSRNESLFNNPVNKFIRELDDDDDDVFIHPERNPNINSTSRSRSKIINSYNRSLRKSNSPYFVYKKTTNDDQLRKLLTTSSKQPEPSMPIPEEINLQNLPMFLDNNTVMAIEAVIWNILRDPSNIPYRSKNKMIDFNELEMRCNLLLQGMKEKVKCVGIPQMIASPSNPNCVSVSKVLVDILFHNTQMANDIESLTKFWVNIKRGLLTTDSILKIENNELHDGSLFLFFLLAISPKIKNPLILRYIHTKYCGDLIENEPQDLEKFIGHCGYLHLKQKQPSGDFSIVRFLKAYEYTINLIVDPILKKRILENIEASRKRVNGDEHMAQYFKSIYQLLVSKDYNKIILGSYITLQTKAMFETFRKTNFPEILNCLMKEIEQDLHNIFYYLIRPSIENLATNYQPTDEISRMVIQDGYRRISHAIQTSMSVIYSLNLRKPMEHEIRSLIINVGHSYLSLRYVIILAVQTSHLRLPSSETELLKGGIIYVIISLFDYQMMMKLCSMYLEMLEGKQPTIG